MLNIYHEINIESFKEIKKARAATLDAQPLDRIDCLAHPGRVGQIESHALVLVTVCHRVARRAGNIGDDRTILTQKRVKQRAFTGVDGAGQCDAHPVVRRRTGRIAVDQFVQRRPDRPQIDVGFFCLVRIIEYRAHIGGGRGQQE